jgi:hypothetical protein
MLLVRKKTTTYLVAAAELSLRHTWGAELMPYWRTLLVVQASDPQDFKNTILTHYNIIYLLKSRQLMSYTSIIKP